MPPPHPSKTLPLFSSGSLPFCQERFCNSTVSIYLFPPLFLSNITLFSPLFFLSYPFLSIPVAPLLVRSLARLFLFRSSAVHIRVISSRFPSSFRLELKSAWRGAACPDRICFVCFSCATLNRDFLAIHAYHHYDIWRRKLQLKWGPPGFETTFVTVGSANRNWSSCCGERDKEIY